MDDPAQRAFVTSLYKGLEVLAAFDRTHPKLTVSDAARRTGTSPASARRSLLTLHDLGFVAHDGKRFWLKPKVLLLANAYLASRPLPTLAQPLLDALAERTRESASVGRLLDENVIIVARSTALRSLSVGLRIGSRLPAHCSATGRVLLAALPPREAAARIRAMRLEPLTPRTVTTRQGVLAHVTACRANGYAVSDGEIEAEVRSLAVPLFSRSGSTVAAMSISTRADRMTMSEVILKFLPALLRAQAELQPRLEDD